jgi:hypothetical protein
LSLFSLGKTEEQVRNDCETAIRKITEWIDMVLQPKKNPHGIKFSRFTAAEQEFNTDTYGIKGNIDATITVKDQSGKEMLTALEIKTGKRKCMEYRGQVLIYSLLIAERFKHANPDNILLYIMDDNVKEGFEVIKQKKQELDALVMARNEIAKWTKLNNKKVEVPRTQVRKSVTIDPTTGSEQTEIEYQKDYENVKVVHLPPMSNRIQECKSCFSKEVCSLFAISIEADIKREEPAG